MNEIEYAITNFEEFLEADIGQGDLHMCSAETALAALREKQERDKELKRLQKEVASLAIESIEREKTLAKLEAEVMAAIDAVPVVRGEWTEDGDMQICSNCGEEHSWEEYRASYCEDCGAKMESEGGT